MANIGKTIKVIEIVVQPAETKPIPVPRRGPDRIPVEVEPRPVPASVPIEAE